MENIFLIKGIIIKVRNLFMIQRKNKKVMAQ